MDLIYADDTRKDIGVLASYSLDMAYGADEQDFSCSVDRNDHCCLKGYFIYVENEEYGGIVDAIQVTTDKDEIVYKGRTWHGILEGKVISPDPGQDYLILNGEANEVLQEIIDRIELSGIFAASTEDSGITITGYQMERYCYGYSGILKMLKEYDAKLRIRWNNGTIVLSAEPRYDYSQDEEFDNSQVDFRLQKNFRPVNHMICLGQGDLRERAVIHIFTDENGGIQPFLKPGILNPVKDQDYVLDESNKVMTDQDEVVEVYDASNAEITTNYVLLSSKPADWDTNCTSYFTYEPKIEEIEGEFVDVGGSFNAVEMVDVGYILQKKQPYDWQEGFPEYFTYNSSTDKYSSVSGTTTYSLLTNKPGNWDVDYEEYYKLQEGNYVKVTGVSNTVYRKQASRPADWATNYGDYYDLYNDGTQIEYRGVSGVTYYTYDRQTSIPSDWTENFGNYYRPATAKELKKNKTKKWYNVTRTKKNAVPAWAPKKYYTKHSHEKAPAWNDEARYTKIDSTLPPTWAANTFYQQIGHSAPTWSAGTYYSETDLQIPPTFIQGKYYRQYFDRLAVMVAEAIEKLAEYHASDELAIDLEETEQVYDVGDIVGTTEQVTGLEATQEVVKKIIKIQNDDIIISYEVQ